MIPRPKKLSDHVQCPAKLEGFFTTVGYGTSPSAFAKETTCSQINSFPSIHQVPVRFRPKPGSKNMLFKVPASKGGSTPSASAFCGSICSTGELLVAHCVVIIISRTHTRNVKSEQQQQPQSCMQTPGTEETKEPVLLCSSGSSSSPCATIVFTMAL